MPYEAEVISSNSPSPSCVDMYKKKKKKKKKTRFNLMFFRKIVKKKKKSLAFLMFLEHQKIRRFYQDERSHHTLI
jgi:hypothetical protein